MTATSVIPSRAEEAASSRSLLSHFYICNYSAERYLDLPPRLLLSCSVLQPNYISEMTFPLRAAQPGSPGEGGEGRDGSNICSSQQEGFVLAPAAAGAAVGTRLALPCSDVGTDRSQLESRLSGSCEIMAANLPVEFINSHLHFSISAAVHQG